MPPSEIYISYAWRDREQAPAPDDRESIVDDLCNLLTGKNCTVRRDKTQVHYKQSIGDFMRDIGAANQVVAVVSDKYLRSKYCMYEAIEMLNHRSLEARLFPLVLDDAKIHDAKSALAYVAFWEKEVADMETALGKIKNDTAKFRYQEELRDLKEIAEKIQDLMTWLADKNTLS
ncbi:MAG: toll/interleukin-1 receptor domain-containing protein, partial [Saprospiraceae bacterium]